MFRRVELSAQPTNIGRWNQIDLPSAIGMVDRTKGLRVFYTTAPPKDWCLIDVGIRAQAIKKTDGQDIVLEVIKTLPEVLAPEIETPLKTLAPPLNLDLKFKKHLTLCLLAPQGHQHSTT